MLCCKEGRPGARPYLPTLFFLFSAVVQRLEVLELRHQGIGLPEAAQPGVVEPGVVILPPQRPFPALAGEAG